MVEEKEGAKEREGAGIEAKSSVDKFSGKALVLFASCKRGVGIFCSDKEGIFSWSSELTDKFKPSGISNEALLSLE